jgi:hypothetical protein
MCPKWKIDATGLATPPTAKRRKIQFQSDAPAFDKLVTVLARIAKAPRQCCTQHKFDDAAEYLQIYGATTVQNYATAALLTRTEASHVLSQLVQQGYAYRSGKGRYRYRAKTRVR